MSNNTTCIRSLEDYEALRRRVTGARMSSSFGIFFSIQQQHQQQDEWHQLLQLSPFLVSMLRISLYVMLMIVSLVGNSLIIVVICSNRELMSRATNYFILNLAVCDLAILASCVWVGMVSSVNEYWVLGSFFCKLNSYMQMVSIVASVLTLVAIACDRYVGVMHPMRTRLSKRHIAASILFIWLVSLTIALPSYLFRQYTEQHWSDFVETYCDDFGWPIVLVHDENGCARVTRPAKRIYYTTVSAIMFFFPMLVMGVTYSIMICKLRRVQMVGESASYQKQTVLKKRKKVITMLIIICVLFAVCWSPLEIMLLCMEYSERLPAWLPHVEWLVYFVAYANTAINPFIYAVMSENYQHGLRQLSERISVSLTLRQSTPPANDICCNNSALSHMASSTPRLRKLSNAGISSRSSSKNRQISRRRALLRRTKRHFTLKRAFSFTHININNNDARKATSAV